MDLLKMLKKIIVSILLLPIQIIIIIPLLIMLELGCPRSEMKAIEAELRRMEESSKRVSELFCKCSCVSIEDILNELEEIHKICGLPTSPSGPYSVAYEQLADIIGSLSTDSRLEKSHCERMAEMFSWEDIQNVWIDCSVRIHILNALERFLIPDKFNPNEYLEHLENIEDCGKWEQFQCILYEEKKTKELIYIWATREKQTSSF